MLNWAEAEMIGAAADVFFTSDSFREVDTFSAYMGLTTFLVRSSSVHCETVFYLFFVACLKVQNMAKNCCQIITEIGTFWYLHFEFSEYLRKYKNTIFENQELFEIFRKYIEK